MTTINQAQQINYLANAQTTAVDQTSNNASKIDPNQVIELFIDGKIDEAIKILEDNKINYAKTEKDDHVTVSFKYDGTKYTTNYFNPSVDIDTNEIPPANNSETHRVEDEDGRFHNDIIENGKIVRQDYYNANGKIDYSLDINDDGQWYRETQFDENGNVQEYFEITFHANGNDASWTMKDANGQITYVYNFDEQNRLINLKDGNGNLLEENQYTEDGTQCRTQYIDGKISSYDEVDADGKWKLINWYDDQGEIMEIQRFQHFDDGSYVIKATDKYNNFICDCFYDAYGNQTSITTKVETDSNAVVDNIEKLLYQFNKNRSSSVLEQLKEAGAIVIEDEYGYHIETNNGSTRIDKNITPSENFKFEFDKLLSYNTFGLISLEEFYSKLEVLAEPFIGNPNYGDTKIELKEENGHKIIEFIIGGFFGGQTGEDTNDVTISGSYYDQLKDLGFEDSEIEKYFTRECYETRYADGWTYRTNTYILREDLVIDGVKVDSINALLDIKNNSLNCDSNWELSELIYNLEVGDKKAKDELENRKDVTVVSTGNSLGCSYYRLKTESGDIIPIASNNLTTKEGRINLAVNILLSKHGLGLISFDELCAHFKNLGIDFEIFISENRADCISWSYNNQTNAINSCLVNNKDDFYKYNTINLSYSALRNVGLSKEQIRAYFHFTTNNGLCLNNNISINGKKITTVAELIKALRV